MDTAPKLRREAEIPRPRSSGAAIVAVASLAMFTAIGTSAFVVRARMERVRGPSTQQCNRNEFFAAARAGQVERALELYRAKGLGDRMSRPLYDHLAATYLDEQLLYLADETERGDCEAVNGRLARLRYLLPDAQLPVTMARCAPSAVWVDFRRSH
jgi:hypothetical protein